MSGLRSWWRGGSATSSAKGSLKASGSSSPAVGSSVILNGNAKQHSGSNTPLTSAQQELSDISDAMEAAALIMNEDIDGAEARLRLRSETSSFHQLGLGIAIFTRSILGFEKEIMTEAATIIGDCETRAWADMKRAQKDAASAGARGSWFGRGSGGASGAGANAHVSGNASQYYPAGSESNLVYAEAQLMNSVILVMQESITEGIKGFYKLRKAFIQLDALMQVEARVLRELKQGRAGATAGTAVRVPAMPQNISEDKMPGSFDETDSGGPGTPKGATPRDADKESDSDIEFVDAADATPEIEQALADLAAGTKSEESGDASAVVPPPVSSAALEAIDPSAQRAAAKLFTNPIDAFVHSGVNMCFGILLLIISMVPPAFSRLLYVIGFKGDRVRGLRMMWQSTVFHNVNGAVAAMVLLGYYNSMLAFSDIVLMEEDIEKLGLRTRTSRPGETTAGAAAESNEDDGEDNDMDEIVGYPQRRCAALLADMRAQYPESGLWRLEEARMLANAREQDKAIAALQANRETRMRQVTALNNFELSMNALCALRWPLASPSFVRCVELNDWSHSTYYYMAGCAEVEMYRDAVAALKAAKEGDMSSEDKAAFEEKVRVHKQRAEEYLRKAPTVAGRKRFMSRQMPIEVFVCRKVKKLEERAERLGGGIDIVDAVGASPALEMIWLWNGSKRMSREVLLRASAALDWSRCTAGEEVVVKIKEEVDECALRDMCDSALLRQLGRLDEARGLLEKVIAHPSELFKGGTRDDYVQAAAQYEIAAIEWRRVCDMTAVAPSASDGAEKQEPPVQGDQLQVRLQALDKCQAALEKVAKWETFTLDARIGMRVRVGQQTVQWVKTRRGWA